METKICPDCGFEKSIEEFSFKNKASDTRQVYCNEHRRLRERIRYQRIKKNVIAKSIRRRIENTQAFGEWKRHLECVVCGEDNSVCIDFHHKDPKQKEYGISIMRGRGYKISRIILEISKCVVVCANCHRKIHNGDLTVTEEMCFKSDRQTQYPT